MPRHATSTSFKIGQISPFKGKKHSEETKQILRNKRLLQKNPKGWKMSEEQKNKISEARKGHKLSLELREKLRQIRIKKLDENPELHPNRKCTKLGKISKGQKALYEKLEKVFGYWCMMEYKIPETRYYADIAIPIFKLDFEYDGKYWHNPEKDNIRDKKLNDLGWTTIRIGEN